MNSYCAPHATIRASQVSIEEKQMFKEIFDAFAGNQSGNLTSAQVKEAVQTIAPYAPSYMVSRLESDYGSSLTWPDFERFMTRVLLEMNPMDEIKRVFELIDSDHTGSINAQQLQKVMEATGEHPPLSEAEAMIHEAANTHSDKVTLNELITFLTSSDED
ncbi:hypothetical protein K450DRAFT_283238 [Umbelopsis ramanniana AG]|uniref:EF-hand domain-containing protein n=1 Tax=Umbelopsis ramanniana AG TaxID=1314678 RepID=A0AAD5HA20_UMBRA|nr:uncharacterized protein K450DRAFT_283238 [Umbelopsis ramanniana AG]KAI8576690.1 hypothetical protein K450DRAFT_283238 [Umbelopsis ramanniana AG]